MSTQSLIDINNNFKPSFLNMMGTIDVDIPTVNDINPIDVLGIKNINSMYFDYDNPYYSVEVYSFNSSTDDSIISNSSPKKTTITSGVEFEFNEIKLDANAGKLRNISAVFQASSIVAGDVIDAVVYRFDHEVGNWVGISRLLDEPTNSVSGWELEFPECDTSAYTDKIKISCVIKNDVGTPYPLDRLVACQLYNISVVKYVKFSTEAIIRLEDRDTNSIVIYNSGEIAPTGRIVITKQLTSTRTESVEVKAGSFAVISNNTVRHDCGFTITYKNSAGTWVPIDYDILHYQVDEDNNLVIFNLSSYDVEVMVESIS